MGKESSSSSKKIHVHTWGSKILSLGKESFSSSKKIHVHTLGSKILSLGMESFSSSKKIHVHILGSKILSLRKASFSSLHTINKPCLLKQVKIAKIRWQMILNFEKLVFYFEAVWLWIWGMIVSQQTIWIFQSKKS